MTAASIHAFGGPEVVVHGEIALDVLQLDEVAVRVEAVGVNPLDLKIMAGHLQQVFPVRFPYVPGTDFSGVVEAVGSRVTRFNPGDRVVGRSAPSAGGALAARLHISAASLCNITAQMSFEQAAAIPTAFGSASQGLFHAGHLRRQQRVLIHAAAGGVGTMAVQLAERAGAYVIATASAGNAELLKSLGAHQVIDYRTQDLGQVRDIDLVLDTVGGSTLESSWAVLRAGGRIVSLTEFAIQPRNGHVGEFVFFADAAPFLPEAMRLFAAGGLQIIIDSIFPLEEGREALEKLATGHARGKVVIRLSH